MFMGQLNMEQALSLSYKILVNGNDDNSLLPIFHDDAIPY